MGASMNRLSLTLLSSALGFLMLLEVTAVLQPSESTAALAENKDSAYAITDLGTLGGPESMASDINKHGQIVGSSTISDGGGLAAFLWENGLMAPLSTTGSLTSYAYAINDLGLIAGTAISEVQEQPTQWPILWAGEIYTKLETINGLQGTARAVNNQGLVAGNTVTQTDNQLLLWQDGSLSQTISITGGLGWANGLNDQGQMAGHIDDGQGKSLAFRWEKGAFKNLGTLGGSSAAAQDINNPGQIVGGASTTGDLATHAFLWEAETMSDLGTLEDVPTATSRANGINDLGIVVGQAQAGGAEHAVLWQDGQIVDLNSFLPADSEWDVLRTAVSINEKGWIVGTGVIAGSERAFLLQPLQPQYLPIIVAPELTPGKAMDMARFMTGDGRLYEVQHSNGSQARHQTQFEDVRFFHTKGNEILAEWEELWAGKELIYRGTDTSPGSGQYYTLYENDTAGCRSQIGLEPALLGSR